jgi:tetratricopeptide (TPR) repeat protein
MMLIDIRLKQLKGEERHRRQLAQTATTDEERKERAELYKQFVKDQAQEEATLFEEVSEQYPTESKWKYEVAKRYQTLERYTDAIPLFQNAVNDPKLRVPASLELGKTFLAADFPDEAADTLASLAETYPAITAGDETAKEIMYWLGRSHEAKGDKDAALKAYSMVVKWDFNYRDTQKRMKDLRNRDKPQ